MMQMTQGWNRLRTAVVTLGLFTCAVTGARADGILTYGTSGFVIGTAGVTGTPAITYESVTNATVDTTSNLPLGEFQVAALPTNQTTVYNNTPFSFNLLPSAFNGTTLTSFTELRVSGVLNGTLTGNSASSVVATINPIANNAFQLGDATSNLTGLPNQILLVPASAGGVTTLEGAISTAGTPGPAQAPVPEPSTIALFLSTVGGLALRRYVLARRDRAGA
jgi:hypothetical protein